MSYCIKDEETELAARQLAKATKRSMAAAIKRACQDALAAERTRRSLAQRLRPIVRELNAVRRDAEGRA